MLAMDMNWHSLFNMGDSMDGFVVSAVYETLLTPSLASKWTEDGMCKQEAMQWCHGKHKAHFIWLSCGFESRDV